MDDEQVEITEAVTDEINGYGSENTVRVVLLKEMKLKIVGRLSGKTYVFDGAGSEQYVDTLDLPALQEKNSGGRNSCCGTPVTPYFEIYEEGV